MDTAALDQSIAHLRDHAEQWARLPVAQKIALAEQMLSGTLAVAERQCAEAVRRKGIPADSPAAGEEYLGGPMVTVRNLRLLINTLRQIEQFGVPQLPAGSVRTRDDGQVVVEVFPHETFDKLLYRGFSAEVWMAPEVRREQLSDTMASFYKEREPEGKVALVLGAGNVASIGPLDVVYKLFVEGQVCLLKMNPVNDYLGPYVEEAFSSLIRHGYLRMAYGGADVGAYLCQHEGIDEIHITGSDRTHDAIVYGTGEEGARRKRANEPLIDKRITSELGNVSPVIVTPGRWSDSELRFQAENIATQMTNNVGFNCNASKVLITHREWPQRQALLDALRGVLRELPQRKAYYPGAQQRFDAFVGKHAEAEMFGSRSDTRLPWTLIPGIDEKAHDDICFTTESFCCITAETPLAAMSTPAFLDKAVAFCNETLWGTLNAAIIIDPRQARTHRSALERSIADLRYGSIGVNHWPALSYGLGATTWGAFPGHTYRDIQSGIGVVHNTLMFDKPQKSVIRGPFRMFPKPPWFVTHKRLHRIAPRLTRFEADPRVTALPGVLFEAILG